jgi:hypothetical protein
LLVLSQKFYRDWHAEVLMPEGWVAALTLPVNKVFQGVVLPEHAQKVRLQFLPAVRFAWVAHVFWTLLAAMLVYRALRRRELGEARP